MDNIIQKLPHILTTKIGFPQLPFEKFLEFQVKRSVKQLILQPIDMISVSILANNPVWEENLTAFSQGAPFRITGRTADYPPEKLFSAPCMQESDAVWIPEMTNHSIEAAILALRHSRHVLLGFPIVDFPQQANQLVNLAREAHVDVQIGHHDRFHPAFRAVQEMLHKPQFIRLSHEKQDLMMSGNDRVFLQHIIHDVDSILALVPEPLKKVQAHLSKITSDIGRVFDIRLEFHNGTVANINLSNLGLSEKRELEVIDYEQVFKVDLIKGESWVHKYCDSKPEKSLLWPTKGLLGMGTVKVDEESLTRECVSFFQRKANNHKPLASIEDGYEALRITEIILKKIGVYSP
ncbi:MAG: Gfo/Idh/MocA family oxidoreductase [Bacteroidales bacterium]|nr:Gfo/Idh/MocA family oxidoreductase [Bacteroidales bacterium]